MVPDLFEGVIGNAWWATKRRAPYGARRVLYRHGEGLSRFQKVSTLPRNARHLRALSTKLSTVCVDNLDVAHAGKNCTSAALLQ
jgi:hypothetical protein